MRFWRWLLIVAGLVCMVCPIQAQLDYTYSGTITHDGTGLAGVQLSCIVAGIPGSTSSTTSDENGHYSFTVSAGASGTITPSLAGYNFDPINHVFISADRNLDTLDFDADLVPLKISGLLTLDGNPLPGATVYLTGSLIDSVSSDSTGAFEFTVSYGGTYTVTPQKSGYTFTPVSNLFSSITEDQVFDFTAAINTLTVSGVITLDGNGLSGVTVHLTGSNNDSLVTDHTGQYSFSVGAGGYYLVTPTKAGYTFDPLTKEFLTLFDNQVQNFTASLDAIIVSGQVTFGGSPLADVRMMLVGTTNDTVLTDISGNYSFTVNATGSYILTPFKEDYTFLPAYVELITPAENQTQDFVAYQNVVRISGRITLKPPSSLMGSQGGLENSRTQLGAATDTPIPGVSVVLSGTDLDTAITDASGDYFFDVLQYGTYAVTPYKYGFQFDPVTQVALVIEADSVFNFLGERTKPIPLLPQDGAGNISTNPRLRWLYYGAENNTVYQVQVSLQSSFLTLVREVSDIPDSSVRIDNLELNTQYYWRVRGITGADTSQWSDYNRFVTTSNTQPLTIHEVDFSPLNDRVPLLLVHGWTPSESPGTPSPGYWDNFLAYLAQDEELKASYKPYYVNYYSNWYSVDQLGDRLSQELLNWEGYRDGFTGKKFVFLCHSMGGLVARSCAQDHGYLKRTKLIVTLGTPHHGSPIANGPARNAHVSGGMALTMNLLELGLFSQNHYQDPNRYDMHWDNFDALLDYTSYPDESNLWLNTLNADFSIDDRLIVYAGQIPGQLITPPYVNSVAMYNVGSYVLNHEFGMNNDGIVPYSSAVFEGHHPFKTYTFDNYNHQDIVMGKGDGALFLSVRTDLMEVAPLNILSPNGGESVQNGTQCEIRWTSPQYVHHVDLYYSVDSGQSYIELIRNKPTQARDSYPFTVPDTNSFNCLIKIVNSDDPEEFDLSDGRFRMYYNWIRVTAPTADTVWERADPCLIRWDYNGIGEAGRIEYEDPAHDYQLTIAENVDLSPRQYSWTIPIDVPLTDQGQIRIQILNLDRDYQDLSPDFAVYPVRTLEIIQPNGGDSLVLDSAFTLRWRTQGNIEALRVALIDSNQTVTWYDTIPNVAANEYQGNTEWTVPHVHGRGFSLRLEDIRRNSVADISDSTFQIRYRKMELYAPADGSNETSCGFNFVVKGRSINYIYSLEISTDSLFRDSVRCYDHGISQIPVELLRCDRTYYWKAKCRLDSWDSYWSDTWQVTTLMRQPSSWCRGHAPKHGATDIHVTTSFIWERSCYADYYRLVLGLDSLMTRIELDTLIPDTLNFLEYSQDTIAFQYHLKNPGGRYWWYVVPVNSLGQADPPGRSYQFTCIDSCFTVNGVSICPESWTVIDSGGYRSQGMVKIGDRIIVQNGYVVVDQERTAITSGEGLVRFRTDGNTLDIFFGPLTMPGSTILMQAGAQIRLTADNLGALSNSRLVVKGIDAQNNRVYLNYIDSLINLSMDGLKQDDGSDIRCKAVKDFAIKTDGHIEGKLYAKTKDGTSDWLILNIAEIQIFTHKLQLRGDMNSAFMIGQVDHFMIGDKFAPAPALKAKNLYLRIMADRQDIDFCRETGDHPDCDDLKTAIPDIRVADWKFEGPKVGFEYQTDIKKWCLFGKATLILPFQLRKLVTGGLAGGLGACFLKASLELYSQSPYMHDVSGGMEGCFSVPVAPFVFFTGFWGHLTLLAKNEKVTGISGGGTLSFDVGTGQFPPLVRGVPGFNINTTGILDLTGELRLFGFITMSKVAFSLDASQKNKTVLYGKMYFESPPYYPWVKADVEGKIEIVSTSQANRSNLVDRMYFTGTSLFQIPGKVVTIMGLNLPPGDIVLQGYKIEVGEFKSKDKSMGKGVQAGVCIFTLSYPTCDCGCSPWYAPWKWDWDCSWVHKQIWATAFVPIQSGKPHLGTNFYDLVKFSKRTYLRRRGNLESMSSYIRQFASDGKGDTLQIYVPPSSSEMTFFSLKYYSEKRPSLVFLNPSETHGYWSEKMIEDSPGSVTDSGFVVGVPTEPGIWKVLVDSIQSSSDYLLTIAGLNNPPQLTIQSAVRNSDTLYTIGYQAYDAEDEATIAFYYTENDSTDGLLINPDELIERDTTGLYQWNVRGVKNGSYRIYGIISDAANPLVKVYYDQPVVIDYHEIPSVPRNFRVIRDTADMSFCWQEDPYSEWYQIRWGIQSGIYTDTITGIAGHQYPFFPETDSTVYYAVIAAENINGDWSPISSEIRFSFNTIELDTLPPAVPSKPVVNVVCSSADNPDSSLTVPYVVITWTRSSDAAGYVITYRPMESEQENSFDVGQSDSMTITGLTSGTTYGFTLQAYDSVYNYSSASQTVTVDLFPPDDRDGDGMNDSQEIRYFGDIDYTNDSMGDEDEDELTNGYELEHGTNPMNHDTDGDRIWDDVDPHPISSADADNDLIPDDWEQYYELDLPDEDPDRDRLTNLSEYRLGTDPINADTDGGGRSDGDEVDLGRDPLNAKDDPWDGLPAAELKSFTARWENDSISLQWVTRDENFLKGFNLYRKQSQQNGFERINSELIVPPADSASGHGYSYQDGPINPDSTYTYWLESLGEFENADSLGLVEVAAVTAITEPTQPDIKEFNLEQNYPNPFNQSTVIRYQLPIDKHYTSYSVELEIFNLLGQRVRSLVKANQPSGRYQVVWNGTNDQGSAVKSGVYFYQLKTDKFSMKRSLLLLR